MKVLIGLSAIVVAVGLASCSGGKYADVKASMKEQVSAMDSFVSGMEKASSGKEAAAALNRYAEHAARMIEQGKKLKTKYADTRFEDLPELKAESEQMQQTAAKFGQAFMKIHMQYGNDPDVQAALKKWQETTSRAANP